jgi:uncharacterized protein DUF3108
MNVSRYGLVLAGLLLLLVGVSGDNGSAEPSPGRGEIAATYSVSLAGFNLGEFHLTASFKESAYEMQAKGRFSLLSGVLYNGSGTTTSTGRLTKAGPEPSRFTLNYKGGSKRDQRRISFAGGAVSQVSIIPQKRQKPGSRVPITKEQLVHVLDPLTAAFLYARSDGPPGDLKVCHQTIPVFDGKQRFDIVLTPKRADSLEKMAPADLSGPVAVCQVKFLPLGGYRPDHPGIKFMTQTNDIEVWLVLLPRTSLYVPYRIFVPTALGTGSATLTDVEMNLDAR